MIHPIGLGIDLLSLSRAKNFLNSHSLKKIGRLFTDNERKKLRRLSPRAFSRLFTAKEAFFKALGKSWMGLEGFGTIEVRELSRDRFQAVSEGRVGEGSFFEDKNWVGAQVVLWNEMASS